MSDTDETVFLGERLLREPRTAALREWMDSFVSEHGRPDPKAARTDDEEGRPLSEVVIQDRDERV